VVDHLQGFFTATREKAVASREQLGVVRFDLLSYKQSSQPCHISRPERVRHVSGRLGAARRQRLGSRSLLHPFLHGDSDATLSGDLLGPLVTGVDVPDYSHAWIIGQHSRQLLRGQVRAVGK
jgi:hypothetical protein